MSTVITWGDFPAPINTGFKSSQFYDSTTITAITDFTKFISDVKNHGFSVAVFGKPFSEVMTDSLISILINIGRFITGNGDLFFLMPAIIFATATFMVGRNKYTKWIIPLLFAYGVSRAFFRILL